jgi:hypothetical protein
VERSNEITELLGTTFRVEFPLRMLRKVDDDRNSARIRPKEPLVS